MQHAMPILPLLPLAALVATADTEQSPEAACKQLQGLLAREVAVLQTATDAASASAAVAPLAEVLRALGAMDRSPEASKALWIYIDNTEGVKGPLIELIQRLTIEFTRLQDAAFFGSAELMSLLAPQLSPPVETPAPEGH